MLTHPGGMLACGRSKGGGGWRVTGRCGPVLVVMCCWWSCGDGQIFSAGGTNHAAEWKVSGHVQRAYDKGVRGWVGGGGETQAHTQREAAQSSGRSNPS